MDEMDFIISKYTEKTFDDAVVSVIKNIEKKGWAIFTIYDIRERLAAKGFVLGKMKIIEFCSAKNADRILRKNPAISICMPCRISVFESDGKIVIASMKPMAMGSFFKGIDASDIEEVDAGINEIINDSI
ncbi:TPA: DUF302 domain-containing protein [Candidatus Micrarchaeota archaeon]|nr:DUF302 domain-containing protein [Candidatus Micrarchaeota archaeon]